MTSGEQVYQLLVETEAKVNELWAAAKAARMDPKAIEVIRNYCGGLAGVKQQWDAERDRWLRDRETAEDAAD